MAQVFISYSRKDKDFVRNLGDALAAQKREAWVDWKDIAPTAKWQQEILTNIETADNFIFVISPESAASPNCKREIDHAVANNKRIVPIFYRSVPDEAIPGSLGEFQRIDFGDSDEFDSKFATLIAALDTDLDWVQMHTRLLTRAKEWEREGKEGSVLLRGKDLREAEQWIAKGAEKKPAPTTLHSQYILASRQAATKLQRIIIGAVAVAFLIAVSLAVYAFIQKNFAQQQTKEAEHQRSVADANATEAQKQEKSAKDSAEEATRQKERAIKNEHEATRQAQIAKEETAKAVRQAKIAVSRQYAVEAADLIPNNLDEAILRAVDAVTAAQTFEARNALFQALSYNPEVEAFLYRTREGATFAINPSGNQIALAASGTLHLYGLMGDSGLTSRDVKLPFSATSSIVFNHSGTTLAVGADDGSIALVDTLRWSRIGPPLNPSGRRVDRLFFGPNDDLLFVTTDGKALRLPVSDGALSVTEAVQIGDPAVEGARGRYRVHYATTATSDGRVLVTGARIKVVVWDLEEHIQQRCTFDIPHRYTVAIKEIAVSPDGHTLMVDLVAGSDGIPLNFLELYSINGSTCKHQAGFTTHKYLFDEPRMTFNNKGDQLLIGDDDGAFYLVNLKALDERPVDSRNEVINLAPSGRPASLTGIVRSVTVKGLTGAVYDPHFAPNDRRVLLGIGTRIMTRIILWNSDPQQFSKTLITSDRSPSSLSFSKDMLVVVTGDGAIYKWKTSGLAPIILPRSSQAIRASFLTEDGRRLSVVEGDQLLVNDTLTGRELKKVPLEGWTPLAMSPNGTLIAQFQNGVLRAFDLSRSVEVWRTQLYDQDQMKHPPLRGPGVSFSKDGTRMIFQVFGEARLKEWNAVSGSVEVFATGAKREWDWSPVLSSDGSWIATAARNYSLAVINTKTREIAEVTAPGSICDVEFSPHGTSLAVSYESDAEDVNDSADSRAHPADYGVFFWDIARKQRVAPTIKVLGPPCHLAFSPEGDRLAIATSLEDDEKTQVLVWDVEPALWTDLALRHLMYQPSAPR